jgi:hypothetical protein
MHCGENSRIFQDTADQTLPVTEFSEIYNWKIKFSYLSRNIQLQVTSDLLNLGKSGSFCHSVHRGVVYEYEYLHEDEKSLDTIPLR